MVPVVAAVLVFQYLALNEKLPVRSACAGRPCCCPLVDFVMSIPDVAVATVVGVVGTKSMTKFDAGVAEATFAALVVAVASLVADEK